MLVKIARINNINNLLVKIRGKFLEDILLNRLFRGQIIITVEGIFINLKCRCETKLLFLLLLMMLILPIDSAASDYSYPTTLDQPWDHSPITVYIDKKNLPPHYNPSYYTQIEKALNYWEEGGNGKLNYTPVFKIVDSENADIRIRWVENLENVEGAPSGVAGYASPRIADGRFVRVDIVLEAGNYQGKSWVQYGDATMLSIVKHELGHALGLGHSSDRRDIMYPEYEQRDNINPILLSKYGPLLLAAAFVALVLLLTLGVSWQRSRKKRKKLEDNYLK
jgi:predicted Zn-dependent protease